MLEDTYEQQEYNKNRPISSYQRDALRGVYPEGTEGLTQTPPSAGLRIPAKR